VIWIAASLNSTAGLPNDLGELLMNFLSFFGHKFDPKTTGINIINQESVFTLTNSNEHAVTIDPVNSTNNTTRSSFRVREVLNAFALVHSRLKDVLGKGKTRNLLKQAFKKIN
jgi:DNA polymerase sigma